MTLICAGESFQLPVTGLAFVQRASLAVGTSPVPDRRIETPALTSHRAVELECSCPVFCTLCNQIKFVLGQPADAQRKVIEVSLGLFGKDKSSRLVMALRKRLLCVPLLA